jgi:hypothetical protein
MDSLPSDVEVLIRSAFNGQETPDGWEPLARIGTRLRALDSSFSPDKYGFDRFVDLLREMPHLVELKKDDKHRPPVYYGRLLLGAVPSTSPPRPIQRPQVRVSLKPNDLPFWKYAYIPTRNDTLEELATLALKENWYFGSHRPAGFQYPILDNYLTYTFLRLQHEKKVLVSTDQSYSAFNTGLVDHRFEPIYALLAPDRLGRPQPWFLLSFCIAGEGRAGKELVSHFNPLPQPAHYFAKAVDMFYDVNEGAPQVDWRHIINDNVDRLPLQFIEENCPAKFQPVNPRELSEEALADYKERFSEALDADPRAYRDLIRRLGDALEVALRRTRWNFKTAIPMYFPGKKNISLLLPLGVLSDEIIDLALVVERTPSGAYLGHTVLPLDWAYSNARLICRPDSDWLTPSFIDVNAPLPTEDFKPGVA